jgi:hypothetical protein
MSAADDIKRLADNYAVGLWLHDEAKTEEVAVYAAIDKVCAERDELLQALRDERDLRIQGQQPEVHWESLRDLRRSVYAATDAAIKKCEEA